LPLKSDVKNNYFNDEFKADDWITDDFIIRGNENYNEQRD